MQMPDVINEVKEPEKNFTFRVRAYRKLTPYEMRVSFVLWNRQRDKRYTLRNKIVEIISHIGAYE